MEILDKQKIKLLEKFKKAQEVATFKVQCKHFARKHNLNVRFDYNCQLRMPTICASITFIKLEDQQPSYQDNLNLQIFLFADDDLEKMELCVDEFKIAYLDHSDWSNNSIELMPRSLDNKSYKIGNDNSSLKADLKHGFTFANERLKAGGINWLESAKLKTTINYNEIIKG